MARHPSMRWHAAVRTRHRPGRGQCGSHNLLHSSTSAMGATCPSPAAHTAACKVTVTTSCYTSMSATDLSTSCASVAHAARWATSTAARTAATAELTFGPSEAARAAARPSHGSTVHPCAASH